MGLDLMGTLEETVSKSVTLEVKYWKNLAQCRSLKEDGAKCVYLKQAIHI